MRPTSIRERPRLPRRLRSARRALGLAGVVALVVLVLPSIAAAAPRATDVDGFYGDAGKLSDYVTLRVETKGADAVFVEWEGHGGGCAAIHYRLGCFATRRSSVASIDFGFHNCRGYERGGCAGAVTRFRVRVRACRRGHCRARTFRGRFAEQGS